MTTAPHTSKDFEQQLQDLGARLVAMGTRAENQIALAVRAVVDRDDQAASEVIAGDAAINQDENEIDAEALQVLALRQPVASDLRFITMCLKAVTDLERIGDLAVNIALRARELNRVAMPTSHVDLTPLTIAVTRGLRMAMASLATRDADGAQQVITAEAQIDRGQANLLAELFAHIATDPATITWVLPLTSVCRYLERIGDHVKSLAEEVIYMVRGEHVRHRTL